MTDVTGIKMAIALGKLGALSFLPRFSTDTEQADMVAKVKKEKVLVGAALGIKDGFMERAEKLAKAGVDILTIDVAHGHMKTSIDATRALKQKFGQDIDIISGVVGTYEGAEDLFKAGADSVRVGVGPGTICITRIQTGVGVPQITAVMEASRAARKYKKTILCDGGTKNSGDIVKGLAAGASAIVAGSLFAGTDEAPGKVVIKDGIKYKSYNASTSLAEKKKHIKNLKDLNKNYIKHIEGVESLVPYKGPVADIISGMEANIRSGLSYNGALNIEKLWQNAQFIRVTPQGIKENGAHDVVVNNK
jgi:IMP dehydrogenase